MSCKYRSYFYFQVYAQESGLVDCLEGVRELFMSRLFQNLLFKHYSKHPLIRTPTGPKNLFEIANVRIIGWILKGNSRKGIKNPFELAKVRIIGRRINGC